MKKVEKKMEDFMKEFDRLLYYNHAKFREAELEEIREEKREKICVSKARSNRNFLGAWFSFGTRAGLTS